MFTKTDIKETIKELGVSEHIVYTGGAMVMSGLKNATEDLDIGLYPDDFYRLREDRQLHQAPFTGDQSFRIDDIEIFLITIRKDPTTVVDGVTIQTMSSVYSWKMQMDRDKDRDDLITLAEYFFAEGLK